MARREIVSKEVKNSRWFEGARWLEHKAKQTKSERKQRRERAVRVAEIDRVESAGCEINV